MCNEILTVYGGYTWETLMDLPLPILDSMYRYVLYRRSIDYYDKGFFGLRL